MAEISNLTIDPRTGFCKSNSVFHSKRAPIPLPQNPSLDVTTFISSQSRHGEIALVDAATGCHLTFPELWRAVESTASCLADFGIRKGHVILILAPNSIYFPVACLAVMSLGAIITTANPLNTTSEIKKQIADSDPVLAFTIAELAPKIADSKSNLPIVLLDHEQKINSSSRSEIVSTFDQLMKKEPSQIRFRERVDQDDTATLLYSSGTTGASKGVITSHRNLIAAALTVLRMFSLDERTTFLCTVPMFHTYGLVAIATGLLVSGATMVVLPKFDFHEMCSAIEKFRVTYLMVVPPIVVAMVNGADQIRRKYDLSSLNKILFGGAPLVKDVIEGFAEKYPTVDVLQAYGLTESMATGASTDSLEESRRYGTAGLLSRNMEAKIVDPDSGKPLGVNQTGELWLKGPSIMKGYLGNAEATALTIDREGWMKTGDLCYFDDEGFLFVVDRLKELIKYKGYQVPPAELEALLLTHPDIVDAAVIPFPNKEVGQYPMAYVVRKTRSDLSGKNVMDFVATQVATYKKIRKVAFVESIPKTASGKILRKDLIKLATSKL